MCHLSNIGLLYVGCVLFINSLMLLNLVEAKSATVINFLVGLVQIVIPTYLIFTSNGDLLTLLSVGSLYLFGFTYIYVALTNWNGLSPTGVGYYCLWVAIMAVIFMFINVFVFNDFKFAFIWLNWSLLWFLFYLILAQNKDLSRLTGYVAMVQSWLTCTIPALAIMLSIWDNIALWQLIVVTLICYAAALALLKKTTVKLQLSGSN